MLSITRSAKFGRRWWKSWPERCRQITRRKWSINWSHIALGKTQKRLANMFAHSVMHLLEKSKCWRNSWLNWEISRSFMAKVAVLEKLLEMRQVLKLNELMDMSPQSKNLFKTQTYNGDKNPICDILKNSCWRVYMSDWTNKLANESPETLKWKYRIAMDLIHQQFWRDL